MKLLRLLPLNKAIPAGQKLPAERKLFEEMMLERIKSWRVLEVALGTDSSSSKLLQLRQKSIEK